MTICSIAENKTPLCGPAPKASQKSNLSARLAASGLCAVKPSVGEFLILANIFQPVFPNDKFSMRNFQFQARPFGCASASLRLRVFALKCSHLVHLLRAAT
jgi:hypothetical protein